MVKTYALTLIFVISLAGCGSRELSRSKVAEFIKKDQGTNYLLYESFCVGSCNEWEEAQGRRRKAFSALGYTQFEDHGNRNYRVTLTEKGKSKKWTVGDTYRLKSPKDYFDMLDVPVGQREFIEVTGILTGQEKVAQAQFTWKWVLNDVGVDLQKAGMEIKKFGEITTGEAVFALYDDGWRPMSIAWR